MIKIHPTELLMKIRYMMEYMTLCGDPTTFDKSDGPDIKKILPSPNGVPLGILLMPDFVIDVNSYLLSDKNYNPSRHCNQQLLDVGGRIGRITRHLQIFNGEHNGLYNLKYLTKVGRLGKAVMEECFRKQVEETLIEPMSLRYVTVSDEPDWVAVYNYSNEETIQKTKNIKRIAESHHQKSIFNIDDLYRSPLSLIDIFNDIRYVIIASKHTNQVISAINITSEGLRNIKYCSTFHSLRSFLQKNKSTMKPPIGILVDLTALDKYQSCKEIIKIMLKFQADISDSFDIDMTLVIDDDIDKIGIEKNKFNNIIKRTNDKVILYKYGNESVSLPHDATNFDIPCKREALTAGYILASLCDLGWKLLKMWKEYFPQMRPLSESLHSKYPGFDRKPDEGIAESDFLPSVDNDKKSLTDEERIGFGILLSSLTEIGPISYYSLIQRSEEFFKESDSGKRAKYNFWTLRRNLKIVKQEMDTAHFFNNDNSINQNELEKFITKIESQTDLHGSGNIKNRFDNKNQTNSLYISLSKYQTLIALCQNRDLYKLKKKNVENVMFAKNIKNVIMFDLDATLLDSTSLRRVCWMNGLRSFFESLNVEEKSRLFKRYDEKRLDEIIENCVNLYEMFVYNNHELFYHIFHNFPDLPSGLQPCDFRQVWNHTYAWVALLWIMDNHESELEENIWDLSRWEKIIHNHEKEGDCSCKSCKFFDKLKKSDQCQLLFRVSDNYNSGFFSFGFG